MVKVYVMLLLSVLATSVSHAAESKCVYAPSDMKKKIVGVGRTPAEAFEDAASQCFDVRRAFYNSRHNKDINEDMGLSLIDECGNIKCGS